jgi:hypothetical protein
MVTDMVADYDKNIEVSGGQVSFLKNIFGQNKILIEIGCFKGKTTSALAENNIVIAIDPFIKDYDPQDLASKHMDEAEEAFREKIKNKNIIWYKEKNEGVFKNWKLMVDGIFVDGCHQYEAVKKDIEWIKFLKEDGLIAFHDYIGWESVRRAVDELVKPNYCQVSQFESIIVFQK